VQILHQFQGGPEIFSCAFPGTAPQPTTNVATFSRMSHRVSQKGEMMGERGPLPRSRHLKALSGERHDRVAPKGLKAQPKRPRMPSWLSSYAKEVWKEIVPELDKLGLISELDRGALVGYCEAAAAHRAASEILNRDGLTVQGYRGSVVKHPAWQIAKDAASQMLSFGGALGLSPAARARLHSPIDEDAQDEDFVPPWMRNE
jgi:P27 family predicted phage terminase small subunit